MIAQNKETLIALKMKELREAGIPSIPTLELYSYLQDYLETKGWALSIEEIVSLFTEPGIVRDQQDKWVADCFKEFERGKR